MFTEKDHVHFVRDGEHVLLEVRVSYPMAVEGGKIEIPTLDGKAELKIPSGIQPGQVLRMRGKGFPRLRSRATGDQLVKVQVDIPAKISKIQSKNHSQRLIFNDAVYETGKTSSLFHLGNAYCGIQY